MKHDKFEIGDTVEVLAHSAWTNDIGKVTGLRGRDTVMVKCPDMARSYPFLKEELKHSQQKLEL